MTFRTITPGKSLKGMAIALAAVTALSGFSGTASAAPFATVGAGRMVGDSPIVEVGYHKRRYVQHRRARNNANAAAAAAIAIGVLGIAAAAAAQPRRGSYVVDNRYYPVDAWGRPIHRARPVQQYEPGYYYREQPRYYGYQEPAWGGRRAAPYGYGYSRQPAYVDQGYGRGWSQPRAVQVQPYRSPQAYQPHGVPRQGYRGGYSHGDGPGAPAVDPGGNRGN